MGNDKMDESVYHMLANILQKYWICEESTDGLLAAAEDNKAQQQQYLTAAVDTKTNQFKFGCGGAAQTLPANPFQSSVPIAGGGGSTVTGNERFVF